MSFGASESWPRGLPLNDISVTSTPCGSAVSNASKPPASATYYVLEHHLPGVTFGVQQFLADVHPDIDAIHRLTRRPLTFSFDSSPTVSALFGADDSYSPYNAQATLHEACAFWGMLLPVTVHGRVSDIWCVPTHPRTHP